MYDLYIVCNTAVNVHNTICIARMCGKTDSCLVTDPDPIFRWHGTSFKNMIRVSRRVFSFLLFVPSSKNTYSHPRCSCSSQWMNEWQRPMIWQTVYRWQWRCVDLCRIMAVVSRIDKTRPCTHIPPEWQHNPLLVKLHWATQFTHRKGRKRMNYCDNSIAAIAVPTVFTSRSTAATIATYRGNQCFVNTVHVDWRSVVHHWGYLFWHIRVGCQPHYRDTACWWSRWCVSWHCPWHRCCS